MTRRNRQALLVAAACLSTIPLFVRPPAEPAILDQPAAEEPVVRMTDVRRKAVITDESPFDVDPWPECPTVRAYLRNTVGFHEVLSWDKREPDGVTVTYRPADGAKDAIKVRWRPRKGTEPPEPLDGLNQKKREELRRTLKDLGITPLPE